MRRIRLLVVGALATIAVSGLVSASAQTSGERLVTKGTVWATSRGPDTVAAFDGATGRVLATIPVGRAPMGLAVPAGSNKLYVGNEQSNSVSVISIPRKEVIATIAIGSRPHHTEASPNGNRVYVAEFGTNKIAVIDVMTDTLVADWETGPSSERTHAPAPSPDGKTLYAVNSVGNRLAALNVRTGAILWSMETGQNPSEILVARDNRTGYMSVRNEDEIDVIDLAEHRIVREVPVGDQPDTLQLTPDGRLLIVALRSQPAEVDIVDIKHGFAVTKIPLAARLAGHNWLSANGRYSFVSAEDPATVHVIDNRKRSVVATWAYPGGGSVHGMMYDDPRATEGPDLSVGPRVTVTPDRKARVNLACAPESVLRCRGQVTLRAGHTTIGRSHFSLGAGSTEALRMGLARRTETELARKGRLRARADVTARDALNHVRTLSSVIVLRPRKM